MTKHDMKNNNRCVKLHERLHEWIHLAKIACLWDIPLRRLCTRVLLLMEATRTLRHNTTGVTVSISHCERSNRYYKQIALRRNHADQNLEHPHLQTGSSLKSQTSESVLMCELPFRSMHRYSSSPWILYNSPTQNVARVGNSRWWNLCKKNKK